MITHQFTSLFLPTSPAEGQAYYSHFSQFDVIFVTGDPYYDHPLSGMALLSRLLDKKGFKVGIIAQPETEADFRACGRPKYFFCITSGLLDSQLANYTPMLRRRENVLVPERALMVYTQKVKYFFPEVMTVLGGVEATIRRFTHFDYKDNALRRGILNDTKADLLLFGNAERSLLELLERIKELFQEFPEPKFSEILERLNLFSIEGAVFRVSKEIINIIKSEEIKKSPQKDFLEGVEFGKTRSEKTVMLPSYEQCVEEKEKFNLLARMVYLLPDSAFLEPCGKGFIQHNRPVHTLTEEEMDYLYDLPFTRKLHPSSKNLSESEKMVEKLQTSVILGRGCWGSCFFCAIPLVQGKEIAQRSPAAVIKEIKALFKIGNPGWHKINDLTLPTLNMYGSRCAWYNEPQIIYSLIIGKKITVYNKKKYCRQQCIGCPQRALSEDLLSLLLEVEKLLAEENEGLLEEETGKRGVEQKAGQNPEQKSLELRSAVRHDLILQQKRLFRKIMQFTTRLKIAPEHLSESVLKNMNKATRKEFEEFLGEYQKINEEQGTHKNLVPYFMAAHPGCTIEDMNSLREFCQEKELYVNLTQVFTPTPGTISTAMYYTRENPLTREKVHVPRSFREKKDQKNALLVKIQNHK